MILAIVEATPAGDRLRARLFLSDGSQQIIPIVLAGVRCPSASKKSGAGEEVPDSTGQAEEFGDEARWFVESKLLQHRQGNLGPQVEVESRTFDVVCAFSIKLSNRPLPVPSFLQLLRNNNRGKWAVSLGPGAVSERVIRFCGLRDPGRCVVPHSGERDSRVAVDLVRYDEGRGKV